MKKTLIPLLIVLLVTACEKETNQIEDGHQNITSTSAALRGNKVDVCHNGNIISVSVKALPAHQAHGDAVDFDGDGYFGIWHGEGTDTEGNHIELKLSLACDFSDGLVVYEFDGGSCTGMLTFEAQSGNLYTYSETVTLGCINNCIVEIEVLDDGKINFTEDCIVASLSAMLSLN